MGLRRWTTGASGWLLAAAAAAGVDAEVGGPERPAAPAPPRLTPGEAESHFRLDPRPLDRGQPGRVVSFADVLEGVIPAVAGVFPSRAQESGRDPAKEDPLEAVLRHFSGLPGEGGEGEGTPRRLPQGSGSGVVVSADGFILTNHHVVADDAGRLADEIEVVLSDRSRHRAALVGTDERTDIAVLKIDANDLPHLTMADSDGLRVGDIVFAVGNPLEVGLTVTMGIVSATGRSGLGILGRGGYEDFIQTDAPINPGNSGGALVDGAGRLVGINTAIISRTGGNVGIGFAVPANLARRVAIGLTSTGNVPRGLLGVRVDDLSPAAPEAPPGVLVEAVEPGLPAERSGLRAGDRIVQVGARRIDSPADLRLAVATLAPGARVEVTVGRGDTLVVLPVVLGDLGAVEDGGEGAPASPPGGGR